MALGLGVLGLSPRDFWRMTPRELARAAEGRAGGPMARPLNGGELATLMRKFPDREDVG